MKRQKRFDPSGEQANLMLFPQPAAPERFYLSKSGKTVTRQLSIGKYTGKASFPFADGPYGLDIDASFDKSWLMSQQPPRSLAIGPSLRIVDLFAGCGGLTVGIQATAKALNGTCESVFASDTDEGALQVYSANLHPTHTSSKPIEELFTPDLTGTLSRGEKRLREQCGHVDFLIGGPPCQGHSDLNNHTRRNDPRNDLYSVMGRAATVLKPTFIIIENVPGVRHSSTGVVQTTLQHLSTLDYRTASLTLNAADYGVAQNRKRHFTVALHGDPQVLHSTLKSLVRRVRPVMWAIDDIIDEPESSADVFATAAAHSATNNKRIAYLFNNNLYELPDSKRPDCHRLKPHAYHSVYGRMRPEVPSPTITSGFGSTGQGRFVHPFRKRTITPHEAARIQFFPDWFSFSNLGRRQLQTYIGNAVPPKLGYILGLALLNSAGEIDD